MGATGAGRPVANWSTLAHLEAQDLDPLLLGLLIQEKSEIQIFTCILLMFKCLFKA